MVGGSITPPGAEGRLNHLAGSHSKKIAPRRRKKREPSIKRRSGKPRSSLLPTKGGQRLPTIASEEMGGRGTEAWTCLHQREKKGRRIREENAHPIMDLKRVKKPHSISHVKGNQGSSGPGKDAPRQVSKGGGKLQPAAKQGGCQTTVRVISWRYSNNKYILNER